MSVMEDGDGKIEDNDDKGHRRVVRSRYSSTIPPPSEWLAYYNQILDRYPLKTKMCTSFLVSAFGSAVGSYLSATNAVSINREENSQLGKSKNKSMITKIVWVDVLSYAIHGALINTPISHYWYEWLSVYGPTSNTASVLVDQLVVQPPLLALMFISLDVLRASIRAALHQFRDNDVISKSAMNALQVLPNSWRFWPFAVYFTFKFLKKKHYTVALNLCSVAWTVYLSRGGMVEHDEDKH